MDVSKNIPDTAIFIIFSATSKFSFPNFFEIDEITCWALLISKFTEPYPKFSDARNPETANASVIVGLVPPKQKHAGPGLEPALSGPTFNTPKSSIHAIEPPPSPIEVTETVGTKIGNSPTISPLLYAGAPSKITATSALVPPTSKLSTCERPILLATFDAPITPAAVPDNNIEIGSRLPSSADITPPLDFPISGNAGTFAVLRAV